MHSLWLHNFYPMFHSVNFILFFSLNLKFHKMFLNESSLENYIWKLYFEGAEWESKSFNVIKAKQGQHYTISFFCLRGLFLSLRRGFYALYVEAPYCRGRERTKRICKLTLWKTWLYVNPFPPISEKNIHVELRHENKKFPFSGSSIFRTIHHIIKYVYIQQHRVCTKIDSFLQKMARSFLPLSFDRHHLTQTTKNA